MLERCLQPSPGTSVEGLVPGAVVEIVEVTPAGTGAFIRYRDGFGLEATRMLTEQEVAALVPIVIGGLTLDTDANVFRLAVEALRLRYAHLLSPLLAVSSSNVEALPAPGTGCLRLPVAEPSTAVPSR